MTKPVFNTFNDIEHLPLRVYNRVVLMGNIKEDFGTSTLSEYIEMFDEKERKQMYIMASYIQKFGKDRAMVESTKGMVLADE